MAPLFHITGLVCHLATARMSMTPLLLLYRFEAGELLRLIERWRGTYVIGPLTAFIAMLEHPSFAERDLSSLTKVASGGAPVYPAVVERWERRPAPTCTTPTGSRRRRRPATYARRRARARRPGDGALSVGVPVAGNESRIVSVEDGRDAAPARSARSSSEGPTVTPGYWRRPEDTSAARSRTAGCTRATSASATRTAGSSSSTGSRT